MNEKKDDASPAVLPESSTEPGNTAETPISAADANVPDLTPQGLIALRWFYERTNLNEADRKKLFERGLIDVTIESLGFRSNPQTNKDLLLEMQKLFPFEVLVESGLWKVEADKPGEPPRPNPQFYGMSLVEKRDLSGKKVRDANGKLILEWVWNNPILIPYFNEEGELVHLRPHKGMMAGKPPQLYVVRPKGQARSQISKVSFPLAIVTEGEFKAAALWQVLGDVTVIAALPGITMAKPLMGAVEEWLEMTGARQVIVAYDNENKSDENLPSYQREKHRRFDTHIWARYLARQLSKQGYEGKVCVLPDAWRDDKGKADWDGALAKRLKELGIQDGSATEWKKVADRIRSEFLTVIRSAIYIGEFRHAKFFDTDIERTIRLALDKISYEPCLPIGGEDEQVLARRLHRLAAQLRQKDWFPLRAIGFLGQLARAYQATAGRYYKMKRLSEPNEEFWQDLQKTARERGDADAKRACDLVLRGRKSLKEGNRGHIPETISDFYFEPHFVLHRVNGTRSRIVTIHNVHGANSPLVAIPWDEIGSPVKLRDFLHKNITGAAWDGGQSELTALHEDMAHAFAFKDIVEVPLRGYHTKSKIWFFADLAISDDGEFAPDPDTEIFWVRNGEGVRGYTFARDAEGNARDREDDVFRQGEPKMHPECKDTIEEARALFKEVIEKLSEALGGKEAYMALGMIFANAAGPEIFKEWSCFPNLWLHGEPGEGKSSGVRWLIAIWGFSKEKGLPLPADDQRTTLTLAALSGAMGQYGNLPLWLDEYQPGTAAWVRAILKNSYDRAEGAKKDFGNSPREYLSSIIVSGVATSPEPQTRSRFAHVQVSSKNRTANHYNWFQTNSRHFYRIGRFLLRRRKTFVERTLTAMRAWIDSKQLEGVDDRARMVHAVAYAGFHGACEVFDVGVDLKGYWTWLVEHCKRSAAEVQESVSVDLFWRELLDSLETGAFGRSPSELRKYFQVLENKNASSPVSAHQTKVGVEKSYTVWKSYLLYFRPGPVLELLRRFKRQSGADLPISRSDLQNQMKTRPYWHPAKNSSSHRQKFGGKSTQSCWCIKVDLHPLGLIRVSDEEFEASLAEAGQHGVLSSENWIDLRKGDLFGLIEAVLEAQSSQEDGQ